MKPTSLVVGMGIGQLYKTVLENLGHNVVTVDNDIGKNADFPTVESALLVHNDFTTAHICTPNFTHFELALKLANNCKIVFIEKPGVADSSNWTTLLHTFPKTRFMMVKNNMWRSNIDEMKSYVESARTIKFKWINKNRIPGPGTWFTTKKLAFGGVSRDLMPHLLSLYVAVNDDWMTSQMTGQEARQRHSLDKIESTEYGAVKRDGVYDVDDLCKIKYMKNGRVWKMEANWADGKADDRAIEFEMDDGTVKRFELGLCPEQAYQNMISDAVKNIDNKDFWDRQASIDHWIHERIQQF
jgi:predicted dehydrogenase